MARTLFLTLAACLFVFALGCAPKAPAPAAGAGPKTFEPIEANKAVVWDRQTTETAAFLRDIVGEFNKGRTGVPLDAQYIGGYSEIFRKVTASIEAGKLPAMAASYESMTSEYIKAGAVAELDPFVKDPKLGYTDADLQDFFPVVMEINRYPQFDNRMYSFPYTKSVLMLYFNETVLKSAGLDGTPPRTWGDFLAQCRAVTQKTGKPAYALNVDASTVDGMIYSMGGDLLNGNTTLFDQPPAIKTFELLETLAKEKLCYQITPQTFDDEAAFSQNQVAFYIRTSSGRTSVLRLMQGKTEGWGIAMLPQADPNNPHTVLFGANVCIFNVPKEQQTAAWEFVKFFTSPDVNVRWALATGYVPIRKSAANDPRMQAFWNEWKYNRAAYDCLPFARPEPKLAGWQKVRTQIEKAETAVLTGLQPARDAATHLKKEADQALK
jgi:ABC-type glycerol-3-phosphate transport system substrate-binding protein